MAKKYGGEIENRDSFPGDETAKGFYVEHDPETDTSGPYNLVFTRDYKDGCLIIDIAENHVGDDIDDMNTSDMITMLLESITFE